MNIQITVNPATVNGKEIGNGNFEIRAVVGKKKLVSQFTFSDIQDAYNVKGAIEEVFKIADGHFIDVEFFIAEHSITKESYLFIACADNCARLNMGTRKFAKDFYNFVQNCLYVAAEESLSEEILAEHEG